MIVALNWLSRLFTRGPHPSAKPKVPPKPAGLDPEILQSIVDHVLKLDLKPGQTISAPSVVPKAPFRTPDPKDVLVWTKAAVLMRHRPPTCAAPFASFFKAEGHDKAAVDRVLKRLAPRCTRAIQPDPSYVERELEHLDLDCYDSAVALAYAAESHDASFAMNTALDAAKLPGARYEAEIFLADAYAKAKKHAQAALHYGNACTKGAGAYHTQWAQQCNLAKDSHGALRAASSSLVSSPELRLEEARAHRQIDGDALAIPLYEKLLKEGMFSPEVRAEFAGCLFRENLFLDAIRVATPAAKAGNADAQRTIGFAHYHLEDWAQASRCLEEHLAGRAGDAEAYATLADCHAHCRRYAAAIEAARASINLTPTLLALRAIVVSLIETGQSEEATEFLENTPNIPVPLEYRIRLAYETGQLNQAQDIVNLTLAQPDNARNGPDKQMAWRWAGYFEEIAGRYASAIICYEHLLALNPGDLELARRIEALGDRAAEDA